MSNQLISDLPLYTGNTIGSYLVINDSGETTTYKTTLETLLLNNTPPQFNQMVTFWNTYVSQPYAVNGNGIIYYIVSPGTFGNNPKYSSIIQATYTGKFMNNVTFDSSPSPAFFQMNSVIQSWQIILQLIKPGGRILFASPSQYCYGVDGGGSIPPNAPLYFDVTLSSVS
jgi:hypothetical protein